MDQQIQKAVRIFKNGGIVIFPTDTAIGIGCRIDKAESVKKIFDLKKRDYSKPLMILVDSLQMAQEYVSIPNEVQDKLLNKYWPGGLTVFLKCYLEKVPSVVRSGTDTLALRLPAHKDIRDIIKKIGVPIIATSANFSGEVTPYSIAEVNKELLSKVDFVLDGECTFKKESTIIDCTIKPWKVLRTGAVRIHNSKFIIHNSILLVDTSDNKKITVGLNIDGQEFIDIQEIKSNKTQIILPMIDEILRKHFLESKDISEIKVNAGPGSYTGLRVGLAIANALSFVLKIPVNGNKVGEIILPTYKQ